MKKLTIGVLAFATCFAGFAACGDKKGGGDVPQGAKDFLYAHYEKDHAETKKDYEVLNTIFYDGVSYTVTWSVDVTEGVTVKVDGNNSIIDVNELTTTDINYVLTATLKDKDGNTGTVSFNRVVLAANALVPAAITSAPVEGEAYKYYVYQANKEQDCYFAGKMNGFYFQTTEEYDDAVDIFVEYVADSETEFYPYFIDEEGAKQYIGVRVSDDGKHDNILFEAEPISKFVWNETLGTITTTTMSKTGEECEFYLGNYNTYVTISASTIDKAATSNVGHLIGMVDRSTVSDDDKIAQEEKTVKCPAAFVGVAEYTLTTAGTTFPDVAVAWAVEGAGATVENGVLKTTAVEANTDITVKATLSVGEKTKEVSFSVTLVANNAESILAAAAALEDGEKFGNEATLSGVVTKVTTPYDPEYGNLTVEMDVNGTAVDCYRLVSGEAADGATKIDVNSEVTVTGVIENYKGAIQFGAGCEIDAYTYHEPPAAEDLSSAEAILNALYALSDGESKEGEFTLTGKITKLDSYNNPTIVVEGFENKPVYCYRLQVTNVVGDTITVTATTMKNYQGTYEFMNCTLVSSEEGEGETEKEEITIPEGGVLASKTIADLITSEGWSNATTKQEFKLDDVVTVKVDGGNNSGKAYDGDHIRIYATDTPAGSLTISVADGYELAFIRITTVEGTYAFLCIGDSEDISNAITSVSGSSVVVNSVKNGENGKQSRVLAIEVVYVVAE